MSGHVALCYWPKNMYENLQIFGALVIIIRHEKQFKVMCPKLSPHVNINLNVPHIVFSSWLDKDPKTDHLGYVCTVLEYMHTRIIVGSIKKVFVDYG